MFRMKMNVLKIKFECFFLFGKKERIFVDSDEFLSIQINFPSLLALIHSAKVDIRQHSLHQLF